MRDGLIKNRSYFSPILISTSTFLQGTPIPDADDGYYLYDLAHVAGWDKYIPHDLPLE